MYDRDDENQTPEETGADEASESGTGDETPVEQAEAPERPTNDGDGAETDATSEAVEPEIVEPEAEIEPTVEEILQGKLDEASSRLRAVSKAYTDLQAEMKSFRDRMENQARFKAERQSFEQARAFFDPVQNLKRSLANAEGESPLKSGVEMMLHQFEEALKKLGMEEIPGVGASFDPNLHEALALTPVTDASQDGKVLMVHADGYTVKGKVLQAAQVVVGKYQEPAGEA